jgi:hypothetical protein
MALPPVARMVETSSWFIRRRVASIDGSSIHCTQCSGAPAATAASRTVRAASALHRWAEGWKAKTIGLRVLSAISALKIVVEVGLVTGVMAQTTPTGSAISVIPFSSSRRTTPTVRRPSIEWVTCSQAKRFFIALSSNTPRPVSATASSASSQCSARAAREAFRTMWSTCSWVNDAYRPRDLTACATRVSTAVSASAGTAGRAVASAMGITSGRGPR